MQRIGAKTQSRRRRRAARRKRWSTVTKHRRRRHYQHRWAVAYVLHVSEGRSQREAWGEYLRRMTGRPGWSVARLHRESGVARQTIFKWMGPRPGGVTMASVRAIGQALDDLPGALRAASGSLTDGRQPILLDPEAVPDEEIAAVLDNERLSNPAKARIINTIFERRERDRLRRIEETRQMIERAAG